MCYDESFMLSLIRFDETGKQPPDQAKPNARHHIDNVITGAQRLCNARRLAHEMRHLCHKWYGADQSWLSVDL
jgi:hypothetical protein